MDLKQSIRGMGKVTRLVEDIARRTGSLRPLWMRLSILGFKDVIDHFSKEEGRSGRWAPLSPKTIAARRKGKRKGFGAKILQDTGLLRQSVHPTAPNQYQQIVYEPNRVILRTTVKYASTHQFGRGIIKARPFMWISRPAHGNMMLVAEKWIAKGQS